MWRSVALSISALTILASGCFAEDEKSPNERTDHRVADIFRELDASRYSRSALDAAIVRLTALDRPSAMVGKAMLHQFEYEDTDAVAKSLEALQQQAMALEHADTFFKDLDVSDYDGSDNSLIENLLELNGYRKDQHTCCSAWQYDMDPPRFSIPCGFFKRHARTGELTRPWSSNHRNVQFTFEIDCFDRQSVETDMPDVQDFWIGIRGVSPNSVYGCGSIYRDRAAGLRISFYEILYRPQEIRLTQAQSSYEWDDTNLHDWALMGRSNYSRFKSLQPLYDTARVQLASYYTEVFDMAEDEAATIAAHAMLGQSIHTRFGRTHSWAMDTHLEGERAMRKLLLAGDPVPVDNIPAPSETRSPPGYDVALSRTERRRIADRLSIAGWPEPLMHLAVNSRPNLNAYLERGHDPDTRDILGKTTLMVAAQVNDLEAAKALVAAGADVNAVSARPDEIPGNRANDPEYRCTGAYAVETGARTPLMYALLEADEALVTYLIDQGADLLATDSAGNTVRDYLQGNGPTYESLSLSEAFKLELLSKIDALAQE